MKIVKLTFFLILSCIFSINLWAQDSLNMTVVGNWHDTNLPSSGGTIYNDIWGYADANGREYAIFGSLQFVHFVDITNPTNPVEIDRIAGGGSSIWRDIKTYDHYAYAVTDNNGEGMMIFDLQYLPDSVVLVNQTTSFFHTCHNVFIDEPEDKLYAAGTNTRGGGLIVLDLSVDPENPTQLASVNLPPGNYVHDLFVRGDTAYCNHGNNGLFVWNFSTPTAPNLLGSLTAYPEKGYNHSSWLTADGDHLVFTDETHGKGVKIADVADLSNITVTPNNVFRSTLLAPTFTNSIAHNPFIKGDTVYLSYYHDGVQVFDISDPDNVVNVAYYDTEPNNTNYSGYKGPWGMYPYLPSNRLIASDQAHGLFILQFTPDYDLKIDTTSRTICTPTDAVYDIEIVALGPFTSDVTLSVSGLPAGATSSFSTNPVTGGGMSQLTISNTGSIADGTYNFTVTATASTSTKSKDLSLTVFNNVPTAPSLITPPDDGTGIWVSPTFSWNAVSSVEGYEFELATDVNFTNLIENETGLQNTSYLYAGVLSSNTMYFWRVRGVNECGNGVYSAIWSFTTANVFCNNYISPNVPINIPSTGAPTITSTLTVNEFGSIEDVNVLNVDIAHTWATDIAVFLTSPEGTTVTLFDQLCNSDDGVFLNFDDEAPNAYSAIPCPPTGGGVYQPKEVLSAFDGEELNGVWTLTVADNANENGGSLDGWELHICYEPSSMLTASANGTNLNCNGDNSGTATAVPIGGTSPYNYLWSNNETTATIMNLAAGTYNVTITDNDDNVATTSVTLTEPPVLTASVTSTETDCEAPTGSATVTASGGTPAYFYSWSNGMTTTNLTHLSVGMYEVTVTDLNECTTTTSTTIGSLGNLTVNLTSSNVLCNGQNTGSAFANVSGGSGDYSYLWSNAATTSTASNLTANTYSIEVTDNITGCTGTANITISEPPALVATATPTSTTCGLSNGQVMTSVSGGTGAYSYLWNNGMTSANLTSLPAATYTVEVTDENGCTVSTNANVAVSNALNVSVSGTDLTCNGVNDGTASANISNGSGDYTYLWNTAETTANLSNLGAGTFAVTATDNIMGCTAEAEVTLLEPTVLNLSLTAIHTTCGFLNGSVTTTLSGGVGGYTYAWNTGAITANLSNVAANTYSVEVTDANGCTATDAETVNASTGLSLSTNETNVTCNGGNDGTASVNPGNGSGDYSFLWNNGASTATLSNLTANTYNVEVTDNINGCTASTDITITEPATLSASINTVNTSCGFNNGEATVSVSGGNAGYTYLWSNGATTETIANLGSGNYSVEVTDNQGCTTSSLTTISASNALNTFTIPTHVTCSGSANGEISAIVVGGSGNYTYLWNNGATTPTITGLAAGNYTVDVTDSNSGCTSVASENLNELSTINLTFSNTNATCGNNNGGATVNVSGGIPNYTYSWNTGGMTNTIINLGAGTYDVTVTDGNGCSQTASTALIASTAVSASVNATNVLCNSGNTGTAQVSALGGTPPYAYLWSTGETSATVVGFFVGNYTVEVTDADGCTTTESLTISEPPALGFTVTSADLLCNGDNSGSVSITPTGGTPPYSYLWDNGATTSMLFNLAAGTFNVTVTDANGCMINTAIQVVEPPVLTATISSSNVLCFGGSSGIAEAVPVGGSEPYDYLWNNAATSANISNLSIGIFEVTVTDDNGCSATNSVTISESTELTASVSSTDVLCFGGTDGTATTSVLGGTLPYTYLWNNAETTASISNLDTGNFEVTVTDANGCTETSSAMVSEPTALTTSTTATDVLCFGGTDGTATTSVLGGTLPYTYLWNNAETTASISNLDTGNFEVTITDANGCTETSSAMVSEPAALTTSTTATDVLCFGGTDGTATTSVLGGILPYAYLWNNAETTAFISNLDTGNFEVTVTDANGCTETSSAMVSEPTALTTSTTATDVLCFGGTDGTATTSVLGGILPYAYLWNNAETTASISNLDTGNFEVTVTDANGCTETSSAMVSEPTALSLNILTTPTICGSNNGTVSATVTGGTPNYTFLWSNGATNAELSSLPSGNYDLEITDANGCTENTTINIEASSNAPTIFTAPSGFFEDGSNIDDYVNSTDCEWLIQPNDAIAITLDFTTFDTESGFDFVRVYDGDSNAATLLGEFSGNTVPPSVTSTGGSLFVQFSTNTSNVANGWDAFYTAEICALDLVINDLPIPATTYTSGNSITSAGQVANGTTVIFSAGDNILLHNDFEVELGAEFEAIIGGCGTTPFVKPPSN